MANMNKTKILGIIFLLIWIAGCSLQQEDPAVPPTEMSAPLVATETPLPLPTETNQPGLVVLLAPAQGWGEQHSLVEQAALERGLAFEIRQEMSVADAPLNLKAVVSFGKAPGLEALVTGFPEVQFVAVGAAGLAASPNLTLVEEGSSLPALGFMAGYIAAVQAEEWRIGIISAGDETGLIYQNAFLNGVLYFCGICNPVFPPYEPYPLYAAVAPGGGEAEVQQAADALISRAVDMVHVAPGLQSEALYRYLAERGVRIVGTDAPPAGLETNWVASVIPMPGMELASVIGAALDGQSLGRVETTLQVNFTGISPSRLSHFAEIISRLASGEIDPVGTVD